MVSGGQPQVLAFHPGQGRMIIWKPLAPKSTAAVVLNARSLVALQQSSDSVIICLASEMLLQSLRQPDADIFLSKGTWVPRRTPGWAFPFVLLSPNEGRVAISAMKLLRRQTPENTPLATPPATP
jgi:hypothetical protein